MYQLMVNETAHDDKNENNIMCDGNKLSCFVCDSIDRSRLLNINFLQFSLQLHTADFNGMPISFLGRHGGQEG